MQDPSVTLDELVNTASMVFYNWDQKAEVKPGRKKEERNPGMPKWWLPAAQMRVQLSPRVPWLYAQKRQMLHLSRNGHWAQKCPYWDKPPKTACYQCYQLEHWVGPLRLNLKGRGPVTATQDWGDPLQLTQIQEINITGLEPRVQMDVVGRSTIFLLDAGATCSVLTSFSGPCSSQSCTIVGRLLLIPLLCLGGIWILPQFFTYAWLS